MRTGRSWARLSRRGACLALLVFSVRALPAQQGGPEVTEDFVMDSLPDLTAVRLRPSGCLASLAPSSMHRVPVFLTTRMSPKLDSTFVLQAGLIAQDVAAQMRKMLGARGEDAPIADGKIAWYSVPSAIVVTARRDGSMRWRRRGYLGDSSATRLLASAFDSARASGTVAMFWPDGFAADSVLFTLGLRPEPVTQAITYAPGMAPIKFAVFYLAVPEASPALPVQDNDMPRYPQENESHRVAGQLVMQFVVDTAGKAIPSTIHDIWPEDTPRLTGDEKRYYDAFVTSVSAWNRRMTFTPARVGVCAVRQLVQLPIRFVTSSHSASRR